MRRKLFTLSVIAIFSLSGTVISAQGIYENDLTTQDTEDEDYGGSLRGLDPPAEPNTDDPAPIGEGLLVLSVLAGGYALVKKRSSKKESNL